MSADNFGIGKKFVLVWGALPTYTSMICDPHYVIFLNYHSHTEFE